MNPGLQILQFKKPLFPAYPIIRRPNRGGSYDCISTTFESATMEDNSHVSRHRSISVKASGKRGEKQGTFQSSLPLGFADALLIEMILSVCGGAIHLSGVARGGSLRLVFTRTRPSARGLPLSPPPSTAFRRTPPGVTDNRRGTEQVLNHVPSDCLRSEPPLRRFRP